MTYQEAINSGKLFNRRKYKDGWYRYDKERKVSCHSQDLSQRHWREEDLDATDWMIKPDHKDLNSNYGPIKMGEEGSVTDLLLPALVVGIILYSGLMMGIGYWLAK